MKAGEIFSKTLPFAWAKLVLGLATVLISALLFGLFMGLALLFDSTSVGMVMFVVWLGSVGVVRYFIMHYIGYMFKAGHIAVITEAVLTGRVPDNQLAYGKQKVAERFATSNVYFVLDKLVAGAVKQIQGGIGKIGGALDFIPGMNFAVSLVQYFVGMSLGYIDECCLGYTFYKKEQGAFKSAADGVVIYAQNWKTLLASAAKTMAMVVLGFVGITLVLFVGLGLLFRALAWPGLAAFVIALLIAMAIKYAFIDSMILARTMVAYMGVAPTTDITFDLYGKLSGLSSKFKELWNKGQQEQPSQPAFAKADGTNKTSSFCKQCGEKNMGGTKFCGCCGAPALHIMSTT